MTAARKLRETCSIGTDCCTAPFGLAAMNAVVGGSIHRSGSMTTAGTTAAAATSRTSHRARLRRGRRNLPRGRSGCSRRHGRRGGGPGSGSGTGRERRGGGTTSAEGAGGGDVVGGDARVGNPREGSRSAVLRPAVWRDRGPAGAHGRPALRRD